MYDILYIFTFFFVNSKRKIPLVQRPTPKKIIEFLMGIGGKKKNKLWGI
jgi:hypothetical protein